MAPPPPPPETPIKPSPKCTYSPTGEFKCGPAPFGRSVDTPDRIEHFASSSAGHRGPDGDERAKARSCAFSATGSLRC